MKTTFKILIFVVFIIFSGVTVTSAGENDIATNSLDASFSPGSVGLLDSQYLRFGQLTMEDGLSNNAIWGLTQDNRGLTWIGTYTGLNRYDGSSVKVYRHNPDDPFSLSYDAIRGLLVDHTGVLWVGTWSGGLHHFDQDSERFFRYRHDPEIPTASAMTM